MKQTFLCFAGSCREKIVEPIYNILINVGLSIWYDYRCMIFGDDYYEKNFIEGIENSRYSLIIITKDIFTRKGAFSELKQIKKLNEEGKIEVFAIIYNMSAEDIPEEYRKWISKYIFNIYDDLTIKNLKNSAIQIASKLYEKIVSDSKAIPFDKNTRDNDNFESQLIEFYKAVDCGNETMKATVLYLLYLYRSQKNLHSESDVKVAYNLRYLLREIINCDPVVTSSILNCMKSLISLYY